jgi:hypothetical protein
LLCLYTFSRMIKLNECKLLIIWLYLYALAFSTAASLYEGNLGTAFRHKSSILWPLILGLMVSFASRSRDKIQVKVEET